MRFKRNSLSLIIRNTPSKIIVFILVLFVGFSMVKRYHQTGEQSPIYYDVVSYYSYLPATFIHKDLSLSFIDEDPRWYHVNFQFWPEYTEDGGKVIKTTMGMSILYMPFFLGAHGYASMSDEYDSKGFSFPYHVSIYVANLFYFMLGLIFLRKTLLKFYSEWITGIVLFLIVLGTNLLYYLTFEVGMSHAFTFSLGCIYIYHVIKWHEKPTYKRIIGIGLLLGLITLIRPVNILFGLFILFYAVQRWSHFTDKIKDWRSILIFLISFFIVFVPQFIYWKYNTGEWIYNSYGKERFYFSNPHVLEGLFSYRKGWYVYTPIMFVATLGCIVLWFRNKNLRIFYTIFLPVFIYITYSWWCWWYGGSFGSRPMVDIYGFMALSLAGLLSYLFKWNRIIFAGLTTGLLLLFWVNIFQIEQYRKGIIHYDAMNRDAYWIQFMKLEAIPNFSVFLIPPDYDKALEGKDEYEFYWSD